MSIARTAARAPRAPAAPSRWPVIDLTALTWRLPLPAEKTEAIAAASSPSPPGVDVAWAETYPTRSAGTPASSRASCIDLREPSASGASDERW